MNARCPSCETDYDVPDGHVALETMGTTVAVWGVPDGQQLPDWSTDPKPLHMCERPGVPAP